MRVVLNYLKRLPNGKFQFRRVWPPEARAARPDLPREMKRNFAAPDHAAAVLHSLQLNREFDKVLTEVRAHGGKQPDWVIAEQVGRWFESNREMFDAVVHQQSFTAPNGDEAVVTETGADFERDSIVAEAGKREGLDQLGHPKRLTLDEELKLSALRTGEPPRVPLKVSDAHAIYKEKHLRGREDRASETAVKQFIAFAGDIPIEQVKRRTAVEWLDHLMDELGQSGSTIRRRLGAMKAIVNFVRKREMFVGDNPFAECEVPKGAAKPEDVLPLHTVHLDAIDAYLKASKVRPETRHLFALLKFTGCRPSEIGGLRGEDIVLDAPIPYVFIREHEGRRLKNDESERKLPLIGGALEAAKALTAKRKTGWLFPSLAPETADANDNPNMSARSNKVIRAAGVPRSRKLVAYSFRHTLTSALDLTAEVPWALRERILGHARADRYGAREMPLEALLDALNIAAPRLGEVDRSTYAPFMLEIGGSTKD